MIFQIDPVMEYEHARYVDFWSVLIEWEKHEFDHPEMTFSFRRMPGFSLEDSIELIREHGATDEQIAAAVEIGRVEAMKLLNMDYVLYLTEEANLAAASESHEGEHEGEHEE